MRQASNPLQSLLFPLCLLVCLSGRAHSLSDQPPPRSAGARRDILDSLQPTLAIVGKDRAVVTTGGDPEDVQEIELGSLTPDVVPEEDEPLTAVPALPDPAGGAAGPVDSTFIEADTGTVQDAAASLGTEPVETGTTPPPE